MTASFAALVLAAVLSKVLGNQIFTPLALGVAAALFLLRLALDERRRRAVEDFLLLFGMLVYALANQDPSYLEHAALLVCLLPSWARLRQLGLALRAEGSVLALLLIMAWSLTWTSNLEMSVAGLATSVLCMAFLFAVVLQAEGDWDRLLRQVLVVLAAILVGSFVAGGIGYGSAGKTFAGVTLHRNQLGFLLGLMTLLCLFALRFGARGRHALGALGAAGLLVYIDSKSAIIALVLTALVFVVASARRRRLYLGLLALALAVFVAALPSPKMDHFALWMGRDPTFTSRTEIWADSLRLAHEQPFTGFGYNAVWSAHENRLSQYPDAPGPRYAHAHNAWIDWVLQLGLGGFAVYLLFLGVLLARALQRARSGPGGWPVALQAGSLLLYIQVYDLANVSTVPVTRFGFFMLGLVSLSLWLTASPAWRDALRRVGPSVQDEPWADAAYGPPPGLRGRLARGLALVLAGAALTAAYALWEDGRRFAATEKRSAPPPNGVAEASYLDARELHWRSAERLADYARRHRDGLMDMLSRSESP